MAKCPWFSSHAAEPDPKTLGLEVGEVHVCERCSLFYWVKSTDPYVLKRAYSQSAGVVRALAKHGTAAVRAQVAPLLARKEIKAALAAKLKIDE